MDAPGMPFSLIGTSNCLVILLDDMGFPGTTKCGCTSDVIDTPTSNCKKEGRYK